MSLSTWSSSPSQNDIAYSFTGRKGPSGRMAGETAYVLPVSPLNHSFSRATVRRPRTCTCRSRSRNAHMRMANDDHQWFGLKSWFKQGEKHDNAQKSDSSETSEGSEKEITSNSADDKSAKKHNAAGNGKDADRGLRFPWISLKGLQKQNATPKTPSSAHNDAKPGPVSGRKPAYDNSDETKKDVMSPLDRWRKIVIKVIAPGFVQGKGKKEDTSLAPPKGKPENQRQNDQKNIEQVCDDETTQQATPEENRRQRGIMELYRPPSEELKRSRKNWFEIPWKKEEKRDASEDPGMSSLVETQIADDQPDPIDIKESPPNINQESSSTMTESSSTMTESSSTMTESSSTMTESPASEDGFANGKVDSEQRELDGAHAQRGYRSGSPRAPLLDIISIPQRDVAAIRLIFGSETFFATETLSAPGGLIFRGNLRGEPKATVAKLEKQLAARLGNKYTLCLAEGEEDLRPVVVVVPTARDKRPASPRQKFMATIVALMTASTCLGRGLFAIVLRPTILALHGHPKKDRFLYILFGTASRTSFTIAAFIALIVVISQVVQRVMGSRYNTRVSIPFLLPSYQLGSFGAVIQIASPTPTRAALFDIALSGVATLVFLSMACFLVGLRMSTSFCDVIPVPMSLVSSSLLMGFLTQQVPDGKILIDYGRSLIGLHPLAVVGANCLTIAALNLLPIRQLDGGRIISALYGRRTAVHASRVTVLFLLLASSKSPYFIVFLAAITFGPWNPDRPSRNELTEPDGFRTIVGYLYMLFMIGILLPFPSSKFFGTI